MLAKLIAHGPTREDALDRLAAALAGTVVEGVNTNLPFLRWLVAHPELRAGRTTTAFLVEHPPLSAPPLRLPLASGAEPGDSTCPRRRLPRRRTSNPPRTSTARPAARASSPRPCPAP